MAVRKIEQRVPGGFDKINALGFTVKSNDNKFGLVSFLGETLRIGHVDDKEKLPFLNHYVLFVDTTDANAVDSYEWTVQFFNDTGEEIQILSQELRTNVNVGLFELKLKPNEIIEVYNNLVVEIKVSVQLIKNSIDLLVEPLVLTHQVKPLRQDLEYLLANEKNAVKGNKTTYRWVGNYLAEYIQSAYTADEPNTVIENIPAEILTAVIYNKTNKKIKNIDNIYRVNRLYPLRNLTYGICNLNPAFSAMFIPKDNDNTFIPINAKKENENRHPAIKAYNQLEEHEIIDIYNLLRFPKSNIKVCLLSLAGSKKYHKGGSNSNDFPDFANQNLTAKALKETPKKAKRCIKNIVAELSQGLHQKVSPIKIQFGEGSIANNCYSNYIQKLAFYNPPQDSENEPTPYTKIKVQVLDVRSGRPIRFAKTKKIVVKNEDNVKLYSYDFSHKDSKRSVSGWSLTDEARKTLEKLGYTKNKASFDTAHTAYWKDRTVNSISVSDISKQYIINDYRSLMSTDNTGMLNIYLPKGLSDPGTISIEIGFWEFPIVLETLKNDTNRISRNTNYQNPTSFLVEWTDNQTTNWDKHIEGVENYGWKVKLQSDTKNDSFKIAEQLSVDLNNTNSFSTFFDESRVHFVLFGMLWCQPIWNPVPSTASHYVNGGIFPKFKINEKYPNDINKKKNRQENGQPQGETVSFINQNKRNLPYIVTRFKAGNTKQYSRGRDYGITVFDKVKEVVKEDRKRDSLVYKTHYPNNTAPRVVGGNRGHKGVDYFAVSNESKVFAVIGGKIRSYRSTSLFGHTLNLKHQDFVFTYAHLQNRINSQYNLISSAAAYSGFHVMSGLHIGTAGRSGKNGDSSSYPSYAPTHLHFEVAGEAKLLSSIWKRLADPKGVIAKLNIYGIHKANEAFFLNNLSPRLFPCDCSGGTEVNKAKNCKVKDFNKTDITVPNICWASRNLHCPHLSGVFKFQAQLTYLFEDDNSQNLIGNNKYLNPGKINGKWENAAKAAIKRFRTKFSQDIWPSGIPTGFDLESQPIDSATNKVLNEKAPYPRTDLTRIDK